MVFLVILTHYLIFPLVICALAGLRSKPQAKSDGYEPSVTLIIAAYNEEKVIAEKLHNSLALDYPSQKLTIIVVSDGSTDSTARITESFSHAGVVSVHSPQRRGKTAALNRAVNRAQGEVLVFSDANSFYRSDALRRLASWFSDPAIGGVTGRKAILENRERESSQGDHFFWDFESRLKTAESSFGSIPTGDGEIFAVRATAFERLEEDLINDDTAITLQLIERGLRVIYDPQAISEEQASLTLEDDFCVKARMVLGGFQILTRYRRLFLPPKSLFALQFLIHKTLRHLMPLLLLGLLSLTIVLVITSQGIGYLYFLLLQILFYGLALLGFGLRNYPVLGRALYLPMYYCFMNLAALRGLFYFLKNADGIAVWQKAER